MDVSRTRLWSFTLLIFMFTLTACTQQTGSKQSGMHEQIKHMTQKLAMDSQVQRAFLKGREATIQNDGNLRKEMFLQNLREQNGMIQDPQFFTQMADMNMDLTRKMLNTPGQMQDRFLETNLEVFEKIQASPAKRNQLIKTLHQARIDAMKEKQMKHLLLKEGMDEHYLALNTPSITPMVLDYTLDVQDRIRMSPSFKKRMLKNQMGSLKAMAEDPEMRPQLVAFMIQLMKDPAMQNEMKKMMMKMMKQQEHMMKAKPPLNPSVEQKQKSSPPNESR